MPNERVSFPRSERVYKHDNAVWREFQFDGGSVVLTEAGQELFCYYPDILDHLKRYREFLETNGERTETQDDIRQYISRGENGMVFHVPHRKPLAIKEGFKGAEGYDYIRKNNGLTRNYDFSSYEKDFANIRDLYKAFDRMDLLSWIVDEYTPGWIGVPKHYGLLRSDRLERNYALMERIDAGVTVDEILQYPDAPGHRQEAVKEAFTLTAPADLTKLQNEVAMIRDAMSSFVYDALADQGIHYADLLPDFHEGNVIVENLPRSIDGSDLKLWIIDQ